MKKWLLYVLSALSLLFGAIFLVEKKEIQALGEKDEGLKEKQKQDETVIAQEKQNLAKLAPPKPVDMTPEQAESYWNKEG